MNSSSGQTITGPVVHLWKRHQRHFQHRSTWRAMELVRPTQWLLTLDVLGDLYPCLCDRMKDAIPFGQLSVSVEYGFVRSNHLSQFLRSGSTRDRYLGYLCIQILPLSDDTEPACRPRPFLEP